MPDTAMPGLTVGPMGNWLAAVGALRMLSRADASAALRWDGAVPVITTALSAPQRDIAGRIAFTPMITPWQSGGGWGAKDKAPAVRLETLRGASTSRLAPMRQAIAAADAVIATHAGEGKDALVIRLRGALPDDALPWLDAAVPLRPAPHPQRAAVTASPIAGTGGNDGRWDLSTTYHEAILAIGAHVQRPGDEVTAWRDGLLGDLLGGEERQPLAEMSAGPYWPATGSPRLANPWQLILLAEGLCAFGDAHLTEFASSRQPWTTAPGPELAADDSPGEAWLPLWGDPMTMPEVALILSGPQPRWRTQDARTPAQMLIALNSGRWPAGVTGYARYGLARRRGQAHVAVPLGMVLPQSARRLAVMLTAAQAAALAGVGESTWRSYVARGQAPRPDARDLRSGSPGWMEATVVAWAATRPGPGARIDLGR